MENKVKLTETDASRLIEALPALYPADFERLMMLYNKGLLCAPMSVAPQLVKAILAEYRRRATSVNPCQYHPIPGKSGSRGRKTPAKGTSLGSPKSTKNPKWHDPYKCDFAFEAKRAKGMTDAELHYAFKDALAATKGANPDKYYDQLSVYRKEIERRERLGNPKGKMYRIPEEELDLVLSLRPGQVYQSYSGPGGTQMDIKRLDTFRYQVWEQAGNKSYIITSNSLHLLFPKGRKGQAPGKLLMASDGSGVTCPACRKIIGLDNPMRKRFKPYYKRWDEYMEFLEETLIPDLKESGSSYAEDFSRILAMLKGEEEIDKEYILWLRTTLIPDSIESGYTSTAHSLQEGLWWLALSESGRKAGIQHRNPIGESSCKNILRHAKIIGTDCLAVEYMDTPKAKREGVRNPDRPWRHDFKVKGIKVWGLKDGSVLLVGPKPLWRSQPNSVTGK